MNSKRLSLFGKLLICLTVSASVQSVLLADDNGNGNSRPTEELEWRRRSNSRLPDGGSHFFVDESERISCPRRNTCQGDWQSLPFYARNCFCDDLCVTYDDCCSDRTPTKASDRLLSTPKTLCRRIEDIDTNYEIYIVDSCPDGYRNAEVRRLCENESWSSVFNRVPVTSVTTKILYRNVYCAICSSDNDVNFWKIVHSCKNPPIANFTQIQTSADFRSLLVAMQKCSLDFIHPTGLPPRKCKSNTARCDRTWKGKQVARNCRNHTDYVYAGLLVFKNKYCAQCNFLDDSTTSCEDQRTPKAEFGRGLENEMIVGSKFTAAVDVNSQNSSLTLTFIEYSNSSNVTRFERHEIILGQCSDGQVFDPFESLCRQVQCVNGTAPMNPFCSEESFEETTEIPEGKGHKSDKEKRKK